MNAIECKALTKTFPDFTLGPVDLTVPEGCVVGLIGENGAGKTTLLRLILSLLPPDGGEATVFGAGNRSPLPREEIGAAPDEAGFPGCLSADEIGQVLSLSFKSWDARTWRDLLDRFALPEKKPFKDYSLGMKKKLSLAAALAHRPRLLILDEPTSGLDPVARDDAVTLFSDFARQEGHAILISSHIVSDLEKLCDYAAFLHRGKLLLCQETDRLREDYGLLRLDPGADCPCALGRRDTPYGAEVLVRRGDAPAGAALGRVDLEDLFILMTKGADLT